jgi:hypothetical protein
MTGFVDQFPHIRRQFTAEAKSRSGYRMDEAEHGCMQRLAAKAEPCEHWSKRWNNASIDGIPNERVADGCEMHANLVGPARLQAAFDQGAAIEPSKELIMRDCPFSSRGILGQDGHFLSVRLGAADEPLDAADGRLRMPVRHRQIGPLDAVIGELAR